MGIFYKSFLKILIDNKQYIIVLANMDRILEPKDIQNKYVCSNELLLYFSNTIEQSNITIDEFKSSVYKCKCKFIEQTYQTLNNDFKITNEYIFDVK